jgi:hypothetical protein
MRDHVPESGLYFFPGWEHRPDMTAEEQAAAQQRHQEKMSAGPAGILVYQAHGNPGMTPQALGTEFASNVGCALVAAILLAMAAGSLPSYLARLFFVTLMGLLPGLAQDASYWNWYGFPTDFTLAAIAGNLIGFFLMGLVIAALVRKPAR